jgi:GT2 family glycosyltransferase
LATQDAAFRFEVIVVESSNDSRTERVVRAFPRTRLIRSDAALLPGAARNLGARHACGEVLAFTDADCKPEASWLSSLMKALDAGAKVAGGAVGNSLPLHPIAVADNLMQCPDFLAGRPAGRADALPGGNLAVRRHDFSSLSGFREDLAAGEDFLLVENAALRWPGSVIFDPRARITHKGRTTLPGFWTHQERFGYFRGMLGSRLKAGYQQRGRRVPFVFFYCVRRYAYFLLRTIQWNPLGLPGFLLISPLIAFGLVAYGRGFMNGCRTAARVSSGDGRGSQDADRQ